MACQEKQSITKGEYFFDFDHIDYYRSEIKDEYLLGDLREKLPKEEFEKYYSVYSKDYPKNLDDEQLETTLTQLEFKKIELDKKVYQDINEIYREKEMSSSLEAFCIPIYRDILIFKKNNSVVGISKVCFDCNMNYTLGSKTDVEIYNNSNDYEKLEKLLYRYK